MFDRLDQELKQNISKGVAVTGVGSAVPETVLTNDDLSEIVETSNEWIQTRTGIEQRRLATPQEWLTGIATTAGDHAIATSGLQASDIDLIILATSTADDLFGSASLIQAKLGASTAVAFDLTAACSGFLFAMVTAGQFIQTGTYQNALVIGADILSRWVDWSDRTTCVLFGDGAGAMVLQANPENHLLGFELRSDGSLNTSLNLAYRPEAKAIHPKATIAQGVHQPITMNGREIYRFAVNRVPEVLEKALFRANLTVDQVDWLVLHQANQRILDAVADRLNIPSEKVLSNLALYGNTSAASIPLVLDEAVQAGRVKPGDVIAAAGFGAGVTWGASIFRWGVGSGE
jgi:3-oxoacyl-[acyl-carrier-protein] synthase-3